jgi:drug/metabolite transporter (DMT)-like permease
MVHVHPPEYHRDFKKGIFFILLAWFFFALCYLISKLIVAQTSVSSIIFFRGAVGTLLILPWMLHNKSLFKTSRPGLIIFRGISSTFGVAFIYLAVRTISLVDATLLQNTAPFFVPFLAYLVLKAPIDHRLWLPIIVGFVGIALILNPNRQMFNIGTIYALAGGFSTAVGILTIRMSTKTEKITTVLFYTFLVGWLISLPLIFFFWKVDSWDVMGALLLLGLLAFLGQWGIFKALQYGKASHIAPFSFSSVFFSAIFDWAIFHQVPDMWVLLGMACVLAGGISIPLLIKLPR